MKVRIVNPGTKKGTKSMARNKKGQFTKGGGRRRRRRRRNPEETQTNPRRRRRRASSGGGSRRRRRRRNPEGGGSGFSPVGSYSYKALIPYLLANVAQAFAVRRWGDPWGTSALGPSGQFASPYRGQAWTLKNYLICMATGWVGAKVIARTGALGGAEAGRIWWRATVEQIATRLLWTEVMARWGWGQQNFGALPEGGKPGDVYTDSNGTAWVMDANQRWVSMAGYSGYGQLVAAGPLGYGELVAAGPLGNDASGGYTPMGHLLPPGTDDQTNETAQQLGLGSRDPYAAMMAAA